MRIIEGSVEEIIEYQRRLGEAPAADPAPGAVDELPAEEDPRAVRSVTGSLTDEDDEDAFFVRQFVYGRAEHAAGARRVFAYLDRVAELGTIVEVGESVRSHDGLTNYLMVRDQGPRRFGAVAYVQPGNVGLTLRLRPDDVADLDDPHIRHRNVQPGQPYAITCALVDDAAVDLALTLTRRALDKVRT